MSTRFTRMGFVAGVLVVAGGLVSGCERKADQPAAGTPSPGSDPAATAPAGTDNASETARDKSAGVDGQDAPDAPRALPKTRGLHGWVKTEPVTVFPAGKLEHAVIDAVKRAALSTFHLQRIARCAYQKDGVTASVLLIEAATPADAFGVFSLMTAQPGTLHPDGTIRAIEQADEATVVTGWQGSTFAQMRCTGEAGKTPVSSGCDELLARILFTVPSAEAPWLLQATRTEKGETAKLWVVRSTAALVASRQPVLARIDSKAMDACLGLKGEDLLAVAAVQVAPGEPPNVVWLASFRQVADAQAAGERYQKALESAAAGLDANTIVDEPKGTYLAGSWTADQESIQNLLPKLRAILPDEEADRSTKAAERGSTKQAPSK